MKVFTKTGFRGWLVLAACIMIHAVSVLAADVSGTTGSAEKEGLLQLRAIPHPDLAGLEDVVVKQIDKGRTEMEAIVDNPEAGRKIKALSYGNMGHLYHAYEFADAAEACYFNAAVLQPGVYRWNYCLAFMLQERGAFSEALEYYRIARNMDVSQDLVYLVNIRIGECYQGLNQLENAGYAYQLARAIVPEGTAVLARMGELALAQKEYQKAVNYLTLALASEPGANKLHYPLAMAYRRLGRTDLARQHLEMRGMVGVQPPDPLKTKLESLLKGYRVHILAGKLAFSAGRYNEAAASFEKAAAADPAKPDAWINLGAVYTKLNQPLKGLESLEKAVRLDPGNMTARYNLGALSLFLGNNEAAVEHLALAVQDQPDDAVAHHKLAAAYSGSGRAEDAIVHYRKAIELDPSISDAWLSISSLMKQGGDFSQALAVLEDAHARLPKDLVILNRLARELATSPGTSLRNGDRALELARELFSKQPDFEAAKTVAVAHAELDQCDEAVEWIETSLRLAGETSQPEAIMALLQRNADYLKTKRPCRIP